MKPWPDEVDVSLSDTADPQFREQVHEAIKAFNDEISPAHREARAAGKQPLDIALRDGDGRLVGGIMADTYWGWLDIDNLWLDEGYRRQGLGTKLLQTAEKEARRRGCRRAVLSTFSFQARDFYEKLGYQVAGQLDDYPPGQSFFWMVKELSGVSGQLSADG
jgi:ribosomal protein S18 acetylase RimI-like enzyme